MKNKFQDEIKLIVRSKISKEIDNSTINIAIMEAEYYIKDYCNINEVPESLKFVLSNMIKDIIESKYIKDKEEDKEKVVSSIKQGDSTINFSTKKEDSEDEPLNKLLESYIQSLNRYRRLRK